MEHYFQTAMLLRPCSAITGRAGPGFSRPRLRDTHSITSDLLQPAPPHTAISLVASIATALPVVVPREQRCLLPARTFDLFMISQETPVAA